MENTKAIVDYAYNDNAKEMRDALYSDIQNRVMAHLDAHKQTIARGMLNPVEDVMATAQDVAVEPPHSESQEVENN